MNYIREINEFYVRLETNSLTPSAISLWFAMMHVNNRAHWVKRFSVAASTLRLKSGLPLSTFKRARLELRDKGFILYTPRGTNAPLYEMVSLVARRERAEVERIETNGQGVSTGKSAGSSENVQVENNSCHVEEIAKEVEGKVEEATAPCSEVDDVDGRSLFDMMREYLYNAEPVENNEYQLCFSTYCFYEDHFGEPADSETDELYHWAEIMGDTLVYEAIIRAIHSGHLIWKYVRGILRNWHKQRLFTLVDVEKAEEDFRQKRGWRVPNSGRQKEILPDWWEERQHVG